MRTNGVIDAEKRAPNVCQQNKMGEKILNLDKTAIVVTGSYACTRAMYNLATFMKKDDVFFCRLSQKEYAVGKVEGKIINTLNEALLRTNIKSVIIYASCLDILTQTDFNYIISRADNPNNVSVDVFLRGPLMKRKGNILSELKPSCNNSANQEIKKETRYKLPPLFPDINNICAILEQFGLDYYLVTAGGCASSIMNNSDDREYTIRHSKLNDIQITLGPEKILSQAIIKDCMLRDVNSVVLMGSAVPSFTNIDLDNISKDLTENNIKNFIIPSDGFSDGLIGSYNAYLYIGKYLINRTGINKNNKQINIIGHDPMVFGTSSTVEDLSGYLIQKGFSVNLLGRGNSKGIVDASNAVLNCVVSSSAIALAKWMESEFNIPYIQGIPVGKYELEKYINKLYKMSGELDKVNDTGFRCKNAKYNKVAIIGEPTVSRSILSYFQNEMGFQNVNTYMYSPNKKIKSYFQLEYPEHGYFEDENELIEILEDYEIIVGDPIYKNFAKDSVIFIALPDPGVSGNEFNNSPNIFAERGAKYFAKWINLT
ncbi:nitrogenase component 1 [Eubacteriales bacterium KG127]